MRDANKTLEVTIVGGGVAGLTAALRLAERGVAVTILEKGPPHGGQSERSLARRSLLRCLSSYVL